MNIKQCFPNKKKIPKGIRYIICTHMKEYYAFTEHNICLYKRPFRAQQLKILKQQLISYFAQKNIKFFNNILYKWKKNNKKHHFRKYNDFSFSLTNIEYRKAVSQSRSPYLHFKDCIVNNIYTEYQDANLNTFLESKFDRYLYKLTNNDNKYNIKVFIKSFKTALILQLVNGHNYYKVDAEIRAKVIIDTLLCKFKNKYPIKWSKNITLISGYRTDMACFK
jgi:uncharacterized UPF0160 family protein